MGTNFYLQSKPPCPCCNRPFDADKHIGKSSAGWVFALCVYPSENINTLEDWKPLLQTGVITDEYGKVVPFEEMIKRITERSRGDWEELRKEKPHSYHSWDDFHRQNDSFEGPNGLLASRRDKLGEGTFQYVSYEFS